MSESLTLQLPLDEKIAYCEALYAKQGLRMVFRLPSDHLSDTTL